MRTNDYDEETQESIYYVIRRMVVSGISEELAQSLLTKVEQGIKRSCYRNFFDECDECPLKKDGEGNPIDWEKKC